MAGQRLATEHRRALHVSNGSEASVFEVAIQMSGKRKAFLTELPAKTTSTIEFLDAGKSGSQLFSSFELGASGQ